MSRKRSKSIEHSSHSVHKPVDLTHKSVNEVRSLSSLSNFKTPPPRLIKIELPNEGMSASVLWHTEQTLETLFQKFCEARFLDPKTGWVLLNENWERVLPVLSCDDYLGTTVYVVKEKELEQLHKVSVSVRIG